MFSRAITFKSGVSPEWLKNLPLPKVNKYAEYYNLDAILVAAVVQIESAGNTWAVRFEPTFKNTFSICSLADSIGCSSATMEMMQKTSWGLMQVMGATAYELGLGAEYAPELKWPSSLLDPDRGMTFGCRYLKSRVDKFGADPEVAYAAYNAGSPRTTRAGMFVNQQNVDKFMRCYRELGGEC